MKAAPKYIMVFIAVVLLEFFLVCMDFIWIMKKVNVERVILNMNYVKVVIIQNVSLAI